MEDRIKRTIEQAYDIKINKTKLVRNMIGVSYQLVTDKKTYLFKLYHEKNTEDAINAINVVDYLSKRSAPVPNVIHTKNNKLSINVDRNIGALYKYIDGNDVDFKKNSRHILKSIKHIYDLMLDYNGKLPSRKKDFYVFRYLEILKDFNYNQDRIKQLKNIGEFLFKEVEKLPQSFCHGDLHTGNMIMNNQVIIYDFDACGVLSKYIDYMTLFDQTNFNLYKEIDVLRTIEFLKQNESIPNEYISSMIAFIPIRHYEIIATIFRVQGVSQDAESFFDQQYHWIVNFYELYRTIFG